MMNCKGGGCGPNSPLSPSTFERKIRDDAKRFEDEIKKRNESTSTYNDIAHPLDIWRKLDPTDLGNF
jgi:hypothetical protein